MLAHSIRVRHRCRVDKFPSTLTNIELSARIERVLPKSGPVAQLGARFHGMEEVIGSIPIRSTNKPNNLADSQKKRDTLSIRWFSCRILRSTFYTIPRPVQKNIAHPALSFPLGRSQGFRVNVHRCGDVCVAHQLLHHFDIFPVCFEQR